jgi:hypothetical protein
VAEGTRVYAGQAGSAGDGPDGLVIEDVSDYQFRRPNPQIRITSEKCQGGSHGLGCPLVRPEERADAMALQNRYPRLTDRCGTLETMY